jgi:hypothetical protein
LIRAIKQRYPESMRLDLPRRFLFRAAAPDLTLA